jgi:uncharacterized membrane protein YozB (DUF420 family)
MPAFSTFSTIAEFFVTLGVFYIVLTDYRRRPFPWKVATVLVIFEFSVNMMYMIVKMRQHSGGETAATETGAGFTPYIAFMAAHGILSLLVFILLAVFSYLAFVAFKRDRHFFAEHPKLTYSFLGLWLVSVVSGWTIYAINFAKLSAA